MIDQDNDGDVDMWVGAQDGKLYYFENTGSNTNPAFTARTGADNPMNGVDVGKGAKPTMIDQDNDGDVDMWVGALDGKLYYFTATFCQKKQTCNGRGVCQSTCNCDNWSGSQCESCPTGAIESAYIFGSTTSPLNCTDCEPGQWSDISGYRPGASCTSCLPGYYGDLRRASSLHGRQAGCKECPSGFKQDEAGQTTCDRCVPGTYMVEVKATKCQHCVRGKYDSGKQPTICEECAFFSFSFLYILLIASVIFFFVPISFF
jgi:hypothetical protein